MFVLSVGRKGTTVLGEGDVEAYASMWFGYSIIEVVIILVISKFFFAQELIYSTNRGNYAAWYNTPLAT